MLLTQQACLVRKIEGWKPEVSCVPRSVFWDDHGVVSITPPLQGMQMETF